MSTLWTPSGEHQVPSGSNPSKLGDDAANEMDGAAEMGDYDANEMDGDYDTAEMGDDYDANDGVRSNAATELDAETAAAMEEQMRQTQEQLISMPAAQVVLNHIIGLFELAALHLRRDPPALDQARLPIDAMTLLVENLGDELGEPESLNAALQQIRLAYVNARNQANGSTEPTPNGSTEPTPNDDTEPATNDGTEPATNGSTEPTNGAGA